MCPWMNITPCWAGPGLWVAFGTAFWVFPHEHEKVSHRDKQSSVTTASLQPATPAKTSKPRAFLIETALRSTREDPTRSSGCVEDKARGPPELPGPEHHLGQMNRAGDPKLTMSQG